MSDLDLNLLVAFDALLAERSVGAAADRLKISAPAMSRTLGRIRRATGDHVLVRTGHAMVPTPFALDRQAEIHELVSRARAVMANEAELDLRTVERVFGIRGHDAALAVIGPALLASVGDQAPGVQIRLMAESAGEPQDLRQGHVDMVVGSAPAETPDIADLVIGADRLVVALGRRHPLARGRLSLERFAAASHVSVSRRGRLRDPSDDVLAEHGLRRRVVASAPTTAAALALVRGSDVVSVVPASASRELVDAFDLVVKELPFASEPIPLILTWHRRYDHDRAHAWLRDEVRAAARALRTPYA